MLAVRYTRGPLAGLDFNCTSAEKYFLVGADFERALVPSVRASLTGASVVYDIGANVGFWSLIFARLCPAGAVYAFEPSLINYERLVTNTASAPNLRAIRAAVSDANGSARFSESGSTSRIRSDGEIEVPKIRLDDLDLPAPSLLKLDIEGDAGAALCGAMNLIRRKRPAILCEIHGPAERRAIERILGGLGYALTAIDRPKSYPFHAFAESSEPVPSRPRAVRFAPTI